MAEIIDAGPSVGEEAIAVFESFLDIKLPRDYRAYLLEFNGGHPEPNVFTPVDSIVQLFYRLNSRNTYDDLVGKYKTFVERIPRELIAIGCDPFGNQICLAVTGQSYGAIYFWDHESEVDPDPDSDPGGLASYDNVTVLADNFRIFLDGLVESEA